MFDIVVTEIMKGNQTICIDAHENKTIIAFLNEKESTSEYNENPEHNKLAEKNKRMLNQLFC